MKNRNNICTITLVALALALALAPGARGWSP